MKNSILLLMILFSVSIVKAQIGIGTTSPDASSSLDITSNNSGVLIPRVNLIDATNATLPILSPTISLLVYNTNNSVIGGNGTGYYYWNGTVWTRLSTNVDDKWTRNTATGQLYPKITTDFVGIGNSNPSYRLDVSGRMRMRSGGSIFSSAGHWLNNSNNTIESAFIGMDQFENVGLYGNTGGGWGFVMNATNGNIGISNQNPNAPLQFSNSVVNRKIVLYDSNNNDHQYYGFGINGGLLRYQTDATAADHAFFAGVNSTSSNELVRIKGNGNVGIGTATPIQKLDVQNGNARINNSFIGDVGHGTNWSSFSHNSQANTTGYGFLTSNDGNYTFLNKQNTGIGYIGFRIGNFDQVVITNAGNMGIGTTTPSQKLDVIGKVKITDGSQLNGRVLTSDGTGIATWRDSAIDNISVNLTASGVNIPAGTTNFLQTGTSITLTPGKYAINVTMLVTNTIGALSPNNSFYWLRSSFSDSAGINPTSSPDIIGSTLISGNYAGTSRFSILTGTIIIQTAITKTYYYMAGATDVFNTAQTISNFGGNAFSENSIIAYRLR